ncbi:unnamed protein product, partial [Vitis vinifera]
MTHRGCPRLDPEHTERHMITAPELGLSSDGLKSTFSKCIFHGSGLGGALRKGEEFKEVWELGK